MPSEGDERKDVHVIPVECCERPNPSPWSIDKDMLRFKFHYFLYVGGLAATVPFTVVFGRDRLGLSATSTGAVLTAQMFLFVFTKPILGYIADYFNRLKVMICVLTVVCVVCYFLLLAVPSATMKETKNSTAQYPLVTTDLSVACSYLQARNKVNVSLLESTFVFTDPRFQVRNCILCCLGGDGYWKKCAGNVSLPHRLPVYETEEKTTQGTMPFRDQNLDFDISSCTDKYGSSAQCSSGDCTEPFCSCVFGGSTAAIGEGSSVSNPTRIFLACVSFRNRSTDHSPGHVGVNEYATVQFWGFAVLFSISMIAINSIFTLSDTACCESIQKSGSEFGKQRLWGSVSWGVCAPIAGFINDFTKDFLASWILMAALLLLFLCNISRLDLAKPHFSQNILGDVGTVLRSKEFLAFEAVILLNGVGTGMIWYYLVWFLTSIGGTDLLCGLCLTVQSFLGAIPFMFFSGWILRKIGHFQVLNIALFAYVVRFLWYSYLQNPWWVLPVEVAHGLTYGLYYTALASYAKLSAKPGTEATTQSVVFSTHEGLGSGIGCVLAGIGFDYIGGHRTFFYAGVFFGCSLVVSIIVSLVIRKQKGDIPVTPETQSSPQVRVRL